LDEIRIENRYKKENLKILKNLENIKNILEKQDKEIFSSTKPDRKLKLKNPNINREINRKRQKVQVTQSIDINNNFSFENISNNEFLKKNPNNMHISFSEKSSKNSLYSNIKDCNKLNFSFSEAVDFANTINNNNKNFKDNRLNNSNIKVNEEINNNNFFKSKKDFTNDNYNNMNKFSQIVNKIEYNISDYHKNEQIQKKEIESSNTFNFYNLSANVLNKNLEDDSFKENSCKIINIKNDLNLDKSNGTNLNYKINEHFNFADLSNLSSTTIINNNIKDNDLNSNIIKPKPNNINSEDNIFSFSNLSNLKDFKTNNNSNFVNFQNNSTNKLFNKSINRENSINKNINPNSKDDNNLFLKPKDVTTPKAQLERLLNENNREELINFSKLTNMRSNINFTNQINNQSTENNNYVINNNSNTNNQNNNPNSNSNSSGKNAIQSNNETIKENTGNLMNGNCQNENSLILGLNNNKCSNSSNLNNNNSKIQPIFNFNQISSFNFIKNPIEPRGTPVNLNTISSIHSNNLERNHSSNVNFEAMLKNYGNTNQNLSAFNSCSNNQNINIHNNVTNLNNQIHVPNISNLSNIYHLNNIKNPINNDYSNIFNLISHSPRNFNMISHSPRNLNLISHSPRNINLTAHSPRNINLIAQSPRNLNLANHSPRHINMPVNSPRNINFNNSISSHTSPKNLISNLMPYPLVTSFSSVSNNIAINPILNSTNNLNNNNFMNQNSDFINFMNLSGGLSMEINNLPHGIGSTPISQQNNFNYNMNILNNPITPSAGNGFLNFSEISKYRSQINGDLNNNLSMANSSILNFNMGNTSTNQNNILNNMFCENLSTPIGAMRKQLNEINLTNNLRINDTSEIDGDKTNKSFRSNKSNQVNIEEVNQMYNNLINKMQVIKNNNPEYYNECCQNYKNLILDSEKRIYIIFKIICDYERLFPEDSSTNNPFKNNFYNNNLNSNISYNENNTNRNSTATFGCGSTIRLDDLSSKNLNTLTNMNSTNNVTSCKSSPWLNAGNINSFEDLAMSYFKKLNSSNKISNVSNDGHLNKNLRSPNINILSPVSKIFFLMDY